MKATLEFNLDEPEDVIAHLRAVKSLNMYLTLWDMDQHLRAAIKYAPDSMSKEIYNNLEETRDKLHEIMSNHSIDLDELSLTF